MIHSSVENGLGVIVLARPERRNALTPQMLDEFAEVATRLGASCDALLIRGEGAAFCAGFDLDLCRDDREGKVLEQLLRGLSSAVQALRGQPCPVVMAVHGAAIAGGCALLGGADVVVAERETKLGYPVARLGISPGVSSPFLASEVAGGALRELQLDTGLLSAERARRLGLVSEVLAGVDPTIERGLWIARSLSGKPRAALRATRDWLQELSPVGKDLAGRGLGVSLGLIGGEELERMLASAWSGGGRGGKRE